MTASEPLILYKRADCHLCDLVIEMLDQAQVCWTPADIDKNPILAEKYRLLVPVLRHPVTGRELYFPFGDRELSQFLEDEGWTDPT